MANFNINKVILGGRLTADPELKETQSGVPVCSFTLAVNRRVAKDQEQKADFINCTAWRKTAEFIHNYFRKGSSLCVAGSIQTRSWEDNNGNKRYATDVVVDEAMFVDGKNDAGQGGTSNPTTYIPEAYNTQRGANFEPVGGSDDLPF
jgi:single-strand DNA-binding protein